MSFRVTFIFMAYEGRPFNGETDDGQTEGQTDERANGLTDKQTDVYKYWSEISIVMNKIF